MRVRIPSAGRYVTTNQESTLKRSPRQLPREGHGPGSERDPTRPGCQVICRYGTREFRSLGTWSALVLEVKSVRQIFTYSSGAPFYCRDAQPQVCDLPQLPATMRSWSANVQAGGTRWMWWGGLFDLADFESDAAQESDDLELHIQLDPLGDTANL